MSRGYRIRVGQPQTTYRGSTTVTGADELCVDVGLLPILGAAEMAELLREALAALGWTKGPGGALQTGLGEGLTAELSPDGDRITVSATTRQEVGATGASQAEADRLAASRAGAAKETATRHSTKRLAKAEVDVRATLEPVIQQIYVRALESKARSMGEVQSIQHGTAADGTVEVTIKVRV